MSEFSSTLSWSSDLSFSIPVIDYPTITTVGDAAAYLATLDEERRQRNHWRVAIRMLDIALREPSYLRAATMSFQTALLMDGLTGPIQS